MNYRAFGLLACAVLAAACAAPRSNHSASQREQAAGYNLQLATDYFRKGNLAQAKEKIERSLEQNPRSAQAHGLAGLLYDRLGEDRLADTHFDRAVSLDPKNPDLLNNYAVYLCRKGKTEQGQKFALQAAADPLYKTPDAAYLNAGICALTAKDKQTAEKNFRQALAIRPRSLDALMQMAMLEFEADRYLSARAFLERYFQAASPNAASLWLAVRIESALGNNELAQTYARRLRSEFPTAVETKKLLESQRTAG